MEITTKNILLTSVVSVAVILGFMFGYPKYKVWKAEQNGKAQFAEAEQNRRIKNGTVRCQLCGMRRFCIRWTCQRML